MWKGLAAFPPHFKIKRGLFTARKGFLILILNPYVVQLSKTVILLENNQLYFKFKYCSLYHCNPTVEEKYIPLETQSQANTPVTPSEPEGSKGKGKRRSEGLITKKKWTPITTQRSRKPQNSASIQGKPTLTAFTGKITIINPVATAKGKFPKSADNKFVQGTVKGKYPKNINLLTACKH
ncbi:hypothetical protein O181_056637 [Austropuccinia psidii MF-1]|uniref:Uncharacterized protein n=1 Tax=Austropuccinia psidii MF-1 TaxID=1389203 RepID=A0A9Q3EB56_9BASI|nr:hypothetical protein [Austropuccinia psidii MF-1]